MEPLMEINYIPLLAPYIIDESDFSGAAKVNKVALVSISTVNCHQ
jgi:hypothetical protein